MVYSSRFLVFKLPYYSPRTTTIRLPSITVSKSYSSPFNTAATTTSTSPTSASINSVWPQRFRKLLYFGAFGGLGAYCGDRVAGPLLSSPPPPGTKEDEQELKRIRGLFGMLPIVQELRRDPDYQEWEAYNTHSEEQKESRFTSGPLKGSRGLAFQRIFWNAKKQKALSVVYFGRGLEGWLSIVHGGVLAAVLDECLSHVAIQSILPKTSPTVNLNIDYRSPSFSGDFYTVHASLDRERSTNQRVYVTGEIRNSEGKACVEATSLFAVPNTLGPGKIVDK